MKLIAVQFRKSNPIFLLYGTSIVLFLTSLYYLQFMNWEDSLAQNLFASSIEVLVVVLLIDKLIAFDRNARLKKLNESHSESVKYSVNFRIVQLSELVGYKFDRGIRTYQFSNKEAVEHVHICLQSENYKKFLRSIADIDIKQIRKLKKLSTDIKKLLDDVKESLEKVQPYPDPVLLTRADELKIEITARLSIISFMIKTLELDLPKKVGSNPRKEKDFWPFYKKMFQSTVLKNVQLKDFPGDEENLEKLIEDIFNFLADVHKRAEDNNLHFTV